MTRALLQAPLAETPSVDFRNASVGTMTAGSVTSATGQFYTWDSNGLRLGFTSALGAGTEGASARWFPPADLDWSDTDTVYVETEWPVDAFSPYLQLFIGAEAGATYTNYISTSSFGAGLSKTQIRCVLPFRLSACSRFGSASTDIRNVTRAIKKIEVRFRTSTDCTSPQSVRVFRIWTKRARPKCILTYDNVFASLHTLGWGAATQTGWRAAGLKGVMHISPVANLVSNPLYMTTAQIRDLYDDGWDVGLQNSSDTSTMYCNRPGFNQLTAVGTTATWVNAGNVTHNLVAGQTITITGARQPEYNGTFTVATVPNDYTFTYTMTGTPASSPAQGAIISCARPGFSTRAEVVSDIELASAMVAAQGWTRGNRFFSYSQGVYDLDTIGHMEAAGIYMSRTADRATATQAAAFDLRLDSPLARHSLPCIIMDGRTAAQVLADIDAAVALGSTFCLLGHGVQTVGDSLHMATAEFETLVAGVKARVRQGLFDVVTPTELMRQLFIGRASSS